MSDEESGILQEALTSFYRPRGGELHIEKGNFTDFLSRNFFYKGLDSGNIILAKAALSKLQLSFKGNYPGKPLSEIMRTVIEEVGGRKAVNIRSFKVFLVVDALRGLNSKETTNLAEYLDVDHDGFIVLSDLEKELSFSS